MPTYKKPGAVRRPGQVRKHAKRNTPTAEQHAIHRRIEAQSRHSLSIPPRRWHPEEYPDLWRLTRAAIAAVRARRRLRGPITFIFEGKRYKADITTLDRVIVADHRTGAFIASSGIFIL